MAREHASQLGDSINSTRQPPVEFSTKVLPPSEPAVLPKDSVIANLGISPDDTSLRDVHLLRRVAKGDRNAFEQLYDEYSTRLYSLATRILSNSREAEEVLQEVFIGIWENAHPYDSACGDPFSWAAMMARNKAINRLRARPKQCQMFTQEKQVASKAEPASKSESVGNSAQDRASLTPDALRNLTHDQRHAIELAFFCGLTYTEIAEALNETTDTIKSRIRSGLMGLRDGMLLGNEH
jgi:RNA polymerase sigma-70 factor (ECF subfamily)